MYFLKLSHFWIVILGNRRFSPSTISPSTGSGRTISLVCIFLSVLGVCVLQPALAQPNINGETGYANMPSGRIEADGTFRMGYSFAEPYSNIWTSITLLPRVELYARYVRIMRSEERRVGKECRSRW